MLRFPRSSGVKGSKHDHMRELRFSIGGDPTVCYMPLIHAAW